MRQNPAQNRPVSPSPSGKNWSAEFKDNWISDTIDRACIKYAEEFGSELKEKQLTTSQIRNVFGEVKRIQSVGYEKEAKSFLLLKPKLAYAASRDGGSGLKVFKQVMDKAHDKVNDAKSFLNYVDFFEAVLAYHKAAGGK